MMYWLHTLFDIWHIDRHGRCVCRLCKYVRWNQ